MSSPTRPVPYISQFDKGWYVNACLFGVIGILLAFVDLLKLLGVGNSTLPVWAQIFSIVGWAFVGFTHQAYALAYRRKDALEVRGFNALMPRSWLICTVLLTIVALYEGKTSSIIIFSILSAWWLFRSLTHDDNKYIPLLLNRKNSFQK